MIHNPTTGHDLQNSPPHNPTVLKVILTFISPLSKGFQIKMLYVFLLSHILSTSSPHLSRLYSVSSKYFISINASLCVPGILKYNKIPFTVNGIIYPAMHMVNYNKYWINK
jgi:hypothetical protein